MATSSCDRGRQVLLILLCGGMKNAWLSGFLQTCGLRLEDVGAIWASSSAAIAGLHFVTGQHDLTRQKWVEVLTRRRVFHWWNAVADLMHLERPRPGKIDYLVEHGCAGLDWPRVWNSHIPFHVGAFSLETGKTHHIQLAPDNWQSLLIATLSPPLITKPVDVPGYGVMRDGGTSVILPVELAYQAGYRRVIVIANEPEIRNPYSRLACNLVPWCDGVPWSPEARQALCGRSAQLQSAEAFLRQATPSGFSWMTCRPTRRLPADTLTRSPRRVGQSFDQGLIAGDKYQLALRSFLNECH